MRRVDRRPSWGASTAVCAPSPPSGTGWRGAHGDDRHGARRGDGGRARGARRIRPHGPARRGRHDPGSGRGTRRRTRGGTARDPHAHRGPRARPGPAASLSASPAPAPTPTPSPSPSPTPALTAVAAFEPHPDDVEHDAKRLAGRLAQALTTYERGADPTQVAADAAAAAGGDPVALAEAAAGLVQADVQSTGAVVYPQLGGLTADATSVMVVVRQTMTAADGAVREETRTLEIRLHRPAGTWVLDRLASDGGPVTPRPADLPPEAVRVLDHPRIDLPDSARWDIHRGQVDRGLLTTLADAGDRHDIGIAVLVTGHPLEVFGTDRTSRHTRGRAFDIYRVDGELVASGRHDGSATKELSRWLYDAGIPELGTPWAFTGRRGGKSFTDAVHQDHLHIGVDA